jgi:hypothetical protein
MCEEEKIINKSEAYEIAARKYGGDLSKTIKVFFLKPKQNSVSPQIST